MARRPVWKGAVSFGMVAIPVKLYTATENKDIAFVTLHGSCHTRLQQRRWCPHHEVEVPWDEVIRGYEYAKDQYLPMERADFDNLPVASLHTVEIVQFVSLAEIDPMHFERSFVLEPEGVGVKPYYLLKQSLEASQRVAIAKLTLRQKEHICCLRPYGHALALHTMFYPDEIRGTGELALPEEQTAITEPEMAMAGMLIDSLTERYDAARFQDEYRLTLERAIAAKIGDAPAVAAAPAAPESTVTDLMEALRNSLAAAKSRPAPSAAPADAPRRTRSSRAKVKA